MFFSLANITLLREPPIMHNIELDQLPEVSSRTVEAMLRSILPNQELQDTVQWAHSE